MVRHIRGRARPSRRLLVVPLVGMLLLGVTSCVLPAAPSYPYWGPYGTRQGVIDKAQSLSNGLEGYVKDFLDGKVGAQVPQNLLPDGLPAVEKATPWIIQRENEIDASKQWIVRPRAVTIDWNSTNGGYPDPNATYLLLPHFLPPFGSKVIINGAFPHARFFDIQATPSFQPEQYHYDGTFGGGENAIVDADINPDPWSVNPFRVGADRNAWLRNYTVTLESKIANAAQTDPSFRPGYRGPGNTRSVTGLVYQGPWADPAYKDSALTASSYIKKQGLWDAGELWMRYYAPDKNVDHLGGVPLPKVTYQLPDGRKFFLQMDLTQELAGANKKAVIPSTPAVNPDPSYVTTGWRKLWGILRSGIPGLGSQIYGPTFNDKTLTRGIDKGAGGRGEDLPAPQNYESSQTLCTYCHYLQKTMSLGSGKVVTLTGRLPTTPKTRNGEPSVAAAQLRYWSLITYDQTFADGGPFGRPMVSFVDDEVITDANGWFTIVLSRPQDRPSNATAANGVTWKDWGPNSNTVMFMMRYLAVGPEWTFAKAPTEVNLGRGSDWASPLYDENLIGKNNRTGWMGEFLPVISNLDKPSFEALGNGRIDPRSVPVR